jgi:hypothetical protein
MSIVELFDYNIVLVCIYRSPDGDLDLFLKNLEILIQKVQLKRKSNFMWGLEINFRDKSVKLQELKNLLLLYNLVNTKTSPTRTTKKSFTLTDAIVIKKEAYECSSTALGLGYSDHLAQIINIKVYRIKRGPVRSRTVYQRKY